MILINNNLIFSFFKKELEVKKLRDVPNSDFLILFFFLRNLKLRYIQHAFFSVRNVTFLSKTLKFRDEERMLFLPENNINTK